MANAPHTIRQKAFDAFRAVVQKSGEFKERAGQVEMARLVADTVARGDLDAAPDDDAPERAIAVIEAGTGVGKSLAACVPAITAALERKAYVIISTATVALQEQLMLKDLPRFAELMDTPFTFALAKGRGRYVCKAKLNRLSGEGEDSTADFFADDEDAKSSAGPSERTVVLYQELGRDLAMGRWNGEKDSLDVPETALNWPAIAADRSTCPARNCPLYAGCSYFEARKALAGANVIVANHDLLLASLGAGALPKLENSLLILDEAHELPEIANGQFHAQLDLSSQAWVEQLSRRYTKVATALRYPELTSATEAMGRLRDGLRQVQALAMPLFDSVSPKEQQIVRFTQGQLPEALVEPLRALLGAAQSVARHMSEVAMVLRAELQANANPDLRAMYSALGAIEPRLSEAVAGADALLQDHAKPDAKWIEFTKEATYIRCVLHAAPIVPGDLLVHRFWPKVRSAVLTSATLTSCGEFGFFLREAGLAYDDAVTTAKVSSPFDYKTQGELIVVKTQAEPKNQMLYNPEVARLMAADFAAVAHGALALFTSRAHMEQTFDALPDALKDRVLMQGSRSKALLLRDHRQRVDQGLPSIILGLQSFGQGVDLPGDYCQTLFIAKLPFTPPTDPVDEAKAEWMESEKRNAFAEISVPATAVRLAQWMGRLIRTETDHGTVICYDKRLVETGYGRRILAGMPPFALTVRG